MPATQPAPSNQRLVGCPATGSPRPASDCREFSGNPPTHNPRAMLQWRACQDCKHRTDAEGNPVHLALVKGWPQDAAVSRERWDDLAGRLFTALGHDLRMERIAKETDLDMRWLELFAAKPELVRGNVARDYPDQPTLFETKVAKLEAFLAKFDAEQRARCPERVMTTVTETVMMGIDDTRALGMIVLIDAASGLGKTEGAREAVLRARSTEGFRCKVWMIRMEEGGVSPLNVLCQIADEVVGFGKFDRRNVPAVSRAIRQATEGSGGVLVIDEAQLIAQEGIQGPKVLNSLRQFCDWGCFGIALLANGEIYRRYGQNENFTQLYRRVAKRVEIFGLKDAEKAGKMKPPMPALQVADVRAVAASWGITDPEIIAWCVRTAELPGALGHLVKLFRLALRDYGVISRLALKGLGVWS